MHRRGLWSAQKPQLQLSPGDEAQCRLPRQSAWFTPGSHSWRTPHESRAPSRTRHNRHPSNGSAPRDVRSGWLGPSTHSTRREPGVRSCAPFIHRCYHFMLVTIAEVWHCRLPPQRHPCSGAGRSFHRGWSGPRWVASCPMRACDLLGPPGRGRRERGPAGLDRHAAAGACLVLPDRCPGREASPPKARKQPHGHFPADEGGSTCRSESGGEPMSMFALTPASLKSDQIILH